MTCVRMTPGLFFTAAATLSIAVSAAANAQELCVVCAEPAATYRCAVEGGVVRPGDPRMALACVTELAKAGPHGSCSARRQSQEVCDGPQRVVGLAAAGGLAGAPPVSERGAPSQGSGVPAPPAIAPGPKGPPETMEELARDAARSSKEQLRKAGETVVDTAETVGGVAQKAGRTVGGAAEKTWHCLTSLFKNC